MRYDHKVIFIVGPTSAGKTGLAVEIAKKFNGEIISADSRQVYRGLDIGTGKEGISKNAKGLMSNAKREELIKSRARYIDGIPQYLIDIVEPGDTMYNLGQFLGDAKLMLNDIWSRGKLPLVVGGTGLYITGLLKGFMPTPTKKGRGQWKKRKKPDFQSLVVGINPPRATLYKKIDKRLKSRLNQGLIGEVEGLIARGVSPAWLERLGLEYRFVTMRLSGTIKNDDELYDKLRFAIHAYARRQLTWLRHQIGGVRWVSGLSESANLITKFTASKKQERGGQCSTSEL